MSAEYDAYLRTHIMLVNEGLRWIIDNLDLNKAGITIGDISCAVDRVAMHDESKTDDEEYDAYDAYFYGGNKSYEVVRNFDYAWLRHIHRNPHHWQYWVLLEDDPTTGEKARALEMPKWCVLEMIADWWSFSRKNKNLTEIFDWYEGHKDKQIMHKKTRKLVDSILSMMKDILVKDAESNDENTKTFSDGTEMKAIEDYNRY